MASVYPTPSERARNARILQEKVANDKRIKQAQLNERRLKTKGMEKYIPTTQTCDFGPATKHGDDRDVYKWVDSSSEATSSTRYEDVNQKTERFRDDHAAPKGRTAPPSSGYEQESAITRRNNVTGVADPTKSITRHRELERVHAAGHRTADLTKTLEQEQAERRRRASPTRTDKPGRTTARQPQEEYNYHSDYNLGYSTHAVPYRHGTDHYGQYGKRSLQQQETMKQQRSIQASMQMAYTVFGNVITALETYEEREARKYGYRAPRKSRIPIPDQDFKNDEDVKASLMSQLKVFETHLKVCPKQVRDDVTSDMKVMVAEWLSARDDPRQFSTTKTDEYAARLFEILVKGSTTHVDFSKHQKVMGKTELMGNFQKVVRGQALADDLDRSFRDDPRKTATRPDVRRGTDINKGLRRIDVCNASLSPYTRELKEPSTSIR